MGSYIEVAVTEKLVRQVDHLLEIAREQIEQADTDAFRQKKVVKKGWFGREKVKWVPDNAGFWEKYVCGNPSEYIEIQDKPIYGWSVFPSEKYKALEELRTLCIPGHTARLSADLADQYYKATQLSDVEEEECQGEESWPMEGRSGQQ